MRNRLDLLAKAVKTRVGDLQDAGRQLGVVFDNAGNLMESRIAYAGIVPDMSEFARQPRADIDALLTADPATPGSTLPTGDIPFAVAFFGKAASEGVSYRVEVKEIRWK